MWTLLGVMVTALAAAPAGLPPQVRDYARWTVVARDIPAGGAHPQVPKVVYANPAAARAWKGRAALGVGSVVVKTGGPKARPDFVAVMRKTASGWIYEEYFPRDGTYRLELQGATCSGCHAQVRTSDFLFTRR